MKASEIGHIHAHGLATTTCDQAEAQAIKNILGNADIPVTAAKSYMGNLGAASGMVEAIASILAMKNSKLFPILNFKTPDPQCPVCVAHGEINDPGHSFINLNITPQGQASSVLFRSMR